MRIAHLNQDAGIAPGRAKGAAVHLEAMREAFRRCGVDVVAVDAPDEAEARAALLDAQRAAPLDLVYERHALGAYAGGDFAAEHGVPLVLEVNAPLLEEERRYRGARLQDHDPERERRLFAGAHRVLAVTRAVARYAEESGAPPGRILVRPNGVDAERFRPRAPEDPLRARLDPEGRFVLGFHGRLRPWHGFPLLVHAVSRLWRAGRPVRLVAVGEGSFDEELQDAGLPGDAWTHVPWVPHEEVPAYVACFDALPLSYPADAPDWFSPLKLMEGMAAGAVPVVPDHGDLPLYVEHQRTGLIYPAGDAEALADAIAWLIERPARHAAMARDAREYARDHSWDGLAESLLRACAEEARA